MSKAPLQPKLQATGRFLWVMIPLGLLVIIPLLLGEYSTQWSLNMSARETLSAVLQDRPANLKSGSDQPCHRYWFDGLLARSAGDFATQQTAWTAAMLCAPETIRLVRAADPADQNLAEAAVQAHPEVGEGWLWLASLTAAASPEKAILYYRTGLELDPSAAWSWVELARLLEPDDPGASIEAYRQACFLGDPGQHGCYSVGRLSEALGDYETALEYYRRSRLDKSATLARALEDRLKSYE